MKNYLIVLSIAIVLFSCKKSSPGTPGGQNLSSNQNAVSVTKINSSGNVAIYLKFTKTMDAACKLQFTDVDSSIVHTDSVYSTGGTIVQFNSHFPYTDSIANVIVTVTSPNYSAIFVNYQ